MSIQEGLGDKGNLALFLSGSLRINNKQQLEELLEQRTARELVQLAPYQDVFMVTKLVGLADCLELLQLTTRAQRRGFIDLDCWRKDSFHFATFMEWMAAFIQCGPEETALTLRSVDPNLLALFLKENVEIFALELDEPPPDLPLVFTPDNRFGIQIISDGEGATLSRLILDSIFRFDPSLGFDLIDRVRWENRVNLEEDAYQNKRRRLEEIGFVDYYEALEIYDEKKTVVAPRSLTTAEIRTESAHVSATLPALFLASLSPGHYLLEALQRIDDQDAADRIRQELASLANRVLSIHTVTPGDLEKVRPALEEIRDTLSIALEHLSQGQPARAVEALRQNSVQGLFRIGFGQVAALRNEADRMVSQGGLRLRTSSEILLESPDEEFFAGIRRLQPLFFQGLDEPPRPNYRNFRTLRDVDVARNRLSQIADLVRGFWRLFPDLTVPPTLSSFAGCNLEKEAIRFGQIFNTACLSSAAKGIFMAEPLDASLLDDFVKSSVKPGSQWGQLFTTLYPDAQALISQRLENAAEQDTLVKHAEVWLRTLSEELIPLRNERSIEPRLVRSVILRLPIGGVE